MIRLPPLLLLFSLSGISALLYQFVWIRMLSHLVGGTSLAISSVLAAYMGGLALGSRYFGARTDRTARPLRLYAWLEIGIALSAALVPFLILGARPVYVAAVRASPDAIVPVIRIGFAMLVLLGPTFLMGGTLPVLCRYVVRSHERLGLRLGLLYAANTAGAVVGAFLAGFVLVESLGLVMCVVVGVALNVAIGLAFFGMDRKAGEMPVAAAADRSGAKPRSVAAELPERVLVLAFALSGFAALGYEIHWTRALANFLGNSTYAYSAMLTTFLLGLSFGGWAGGALADRVRDRARLLGWVQIGAGAAVLGTVPLIWVVLPQLAGDAFLTPDRVAWSSFLFRRFLVAFGVMALPTFLLGMTFPIVNRIGIRDLGRVGGEVGTLYFANTIGAILGSLAAGFLVMPLLGPRDGILVTAALNLGVGVFVLGARKRAGGERVVAAAVAVLLFVVAIPASRAGRGILADSQAPEDTVILDREDPIAATRVYRKPSGELHIAVDGHRIGGSSAGMRRKEQVLAHLPLVLVPEARKVLIVGLGSGITLGSLARYDEIRELTCVEIVPAVVDGAALFAQYNGNVLEDPRLDLVIEDGVQFLLTSNDHFDIISSDSKLNPHYVGNAPLLSRDYYELCRDHLTDSGVMVQWLPLHLPENIMQMVLRSFADAFPHHALFWHYPYNLIQIGSLSPIEVDLDRARRFAADPALAEELSFLQLENPEAMASLFVATDEGVETALGDGPRNTWMRPRLEFQVIREHLARPTNLHEDDNLQWLLQARDPAGPTVIGTYDADALDRFLFSSGKLLEGYAAGGGIARIATGRGYFEEGLRRNPDDWRLEHIVRLLGGPSR